VSQGPSGQLLRLAGRKVGPPLVLELGQVDVLDQLLDRSEVTDEDPVPTQPENTPAAAQVRCPALQFPRSIWESCVLIQDRMVGSCPLT
jgi:hypothetical protein